MSESQITAATIVAIYMGIVLAVGVWVGRRQTSSASWQFGGGLSVPAIVAMLLGTRLGAASTVGLVEDVYETGIVSFSFITGAVLGQVICGFTTGRLFYRTKMMTLTAFSFHRMGKPVTFLAIINDMFIGLAVNGLQVLGVGLILSSITGLPVYVGVIIGSFLGWIYLTLGGIRSTAATNIIHLCVCFFGVMLATVLLIGMKPPSEVIAAVPGDLLRPFVPAMLIVRWTIVGVAISLVANVYHSPLATAKSEAKAVQASTLTGVAYLAFGIPVTLMGLYAIGFAAPIFQEATGTELPGASAFGYFAALLGNPEHGGSAFGGIAGLILMSGVVGAIISTMAPLAWAISTILSRDVYRRFLKPDATDAEELFATRIFSTIYWVVPAVIALSVKGGLLKALLFLLELPAGGVFAAVLCFYWDRVNNSSAFWTLLTSISMGVLHKIVDLTNPAILEPMGPWFGSALGWILTASALVFFPLVFFGKPATDEQLEVTRRARANAEPLPDAPGVLLEKAMRSE